ncbi:MAG: hypothetical protein JWN52_6713 [Actinomycetia bacterium]|nr:hypothetical protein [Actinomycetes bacterium]
MGSMASWIGSGTGLVMIGVAFLISKYKSELPHKASPWMTRAEIVLMFMGSSVLVLTVAGKWIVGHPLTWVVSHSGGWGPAIAKIVAASLVLTAGLGLWRAWERAAKAAVVLPFVLALFTAGFLHDVNQMLTPNARHGADQVSNWIGKTDHKKGSKK